MHVTLLGDDLGILEVPLSCAPNRESDQHNYTTLVHLGPLAGAFAETELTGRTFTIGRTPSGDFVLSIT